MTLNSWLNLATKRLKNIHTARLDALILLEDATGKERGWLLAHPEFEIESKIATKLQQQIEKRANHVPLAYIRGKSEFYGREFLVTPATLQPRPETETMITLLKNLLKHKTSLAEVRPLQVEKDDVVIVDVGTGSGCIGITAKLEFPEAEVYATEINDDALEIARKNAGKLHADVIFLEGNLLEPLSNIKYQISVLLCNLPYVPDSHTINEAAMQEPKIAIFGGEDGLELYRELFRQISDSRSQLSEKPKYIFTESLPFQHEALKEIAKRYGFAQTTEADFIQVFTN